MSDELTIILADDDDGHAFLVQQNLREAGLQNQIVRVSEGQGVLDFIHRAGPYRALGSHGPLLVLLDINMPRLDGVTVLRRLKADPTTNELPVVMLTTTDDPREVQRCYESGCSSYITKPVGYDQFIEAIRRLGLFLSIIQLPRGARPPAPTFALGNSPCGE